MIDCIEKQQQVNGQHHPNLLADSMLIEHQQQQQPSLTSSQQQQALLTMYPSGQQLIELPSQQQQQQQQQQQHQQQSNNELIGYYFGSISRETAEWILKTHGNEMDGAYLLRSSGSNDDFVLSLMVSIDSNNQNTTVVPLGGQQASSSPENLEVLHYKIVETEDSFVALHGQVGDEKFATIDELIEKAQGVATKPRWPINRQSLESQILPPTYWGLSVDQIRLAILLKAKQWGFPLLMPNFQQQQHHENVPTQNNLTEGANQTQLNATTLNNETIRTLIYKSLHEFQPWFHGKISRETAERRIEEGPPRDGRFLVRERDNYSYAMCISHKKTTKHYRIDVLPTGELAIQDGRKFTSLMALVSHYTIMSDGLWCALTEACPRPIQQQQQAPNQICNLGNQNLNRSIAGWNAPVSDIGLPANGDSNMFQNHLAQVRLTAQINQANNLYCVPPISNYISNANGMNQMILPVIAAANGAVPPQQPPPPPPPNHISSGNSSAEHPPKQVDPLSGIQSSSMDSAGRGNNGISSATKNQQQQQHQATSSLICSHHGSGGGVTSIKAPIKEWLQTINHKWSQLLAAKSQHQSLNSFLFGNQNPLNNHCRRNQHHQHHHHHHHKRKCRNGHTSCGCIQQMIIANSAPVSTLNQPASSFNGNHQTQPLQSRSKDQLEMCTAAAAATTKVQNCCSAALCPATMIKNRQSQQQLLHSTQLALQNNLTDLSASLNANNHPSLLSCLPQNSGFTLSGQSYIGSSLFAVRQTTMTTTPSQKSPKNHHRQEGGGQQSGSSGNSDSGTASAEEKLISPAESSANLNNAYNTDIYGSQTSTAIVNDRLPATSSSSSSGGTNILALQKRAAELNGNGARKFSQPQCATTTVAIPYNRCATIGGIERNRAAAPAAQTAGPILCGQHAGPAYRYTNCNDENSFKACFHRTPATGYRASDDSQLATPSTQLAGPAAMAKFVQFQDGQCLRTHRDTRSIQMAYLSSRQTASSGNQRNVLRNNQVPLRELNNTQDFNVQQNQQQQQQQQQQQNSFYLAAQNNALASNFGNMRAGTVNNPYSANDSLLSSASLSTFASRQQASYNLFNREQQNAHCTAIGGQQQHDKNNACQVANDIDLMDCGEDQEDAGFDFKYDPKLIKSSSIETLCGVGEERDDVILMADAGFESCKSNAELMMSLQSCWFSNQGQQQHQQQPPNILHPIQSFQANAPDVGHNGPCAQVAATYAAEAANDATGATDNQASLLSKLIKIDASQNQQQLDHMKKKHDLDELTTALLAELTASLKAQVDLKNKRSGFVLHNPEKPDKSQHISPSLKEEEQQQQQQSVEHSQTNAEMNPLELINEFDTLISNNR